MRIHRGILAIAALVALGASAAAGGGHRRRPGAGPAPRIRRVSLLPRVRQEGGATARRPLGARRRRRRGSARSRPGAARDAVAGAPGADTDFSGHERPGGGRRRARSREDRRTHPVRRLERARERVRRPLPPAQARGEPAPREGVGARAPARPRPAARALSGIPDAVPIDGGIAIRAPWPYPSQSVITEIDATDPRRMHVVRTLELDGGYLTARLVGHVARIVLSSPIGIDLPFVAPGSAGAPDAASATDQNRAVVRSAGARSWLPGHTAAQRDRPDAEHGAARPVPQRPAAGELLGPRPA